MGQKASVIGERLGVIRSWDSQWFADGKKYGQFLHEDLKIRAAVKRRAVQAGVSRVVIDRPPGKCVVNVEVARPGVIIGRKGEAIAQLRTYLSGFTDSALHLNVLEIRNPETDSQLVSESIAQQLERRIAFRRAMKRAIQSAMRAGALGIRVNVSGRLGGSEIARMEWYKEGRVPRQTLRADIDYGFSEAKTTYGVIGVKVWIFKGEVIEHDPSAERRRRIEANKPRGAETNKPRVGGDNVTPFRQKARIDAPNTPESRPSAFSGRVTAPGDDSLVPPPVIEHASRDQEPGPEAEPPPLSPNWPAEAERDLMQAFNQLSVGEIARQVAIETLLRHGRSAMRARAVPRPLTKRLASIMPTLFECLFDPAEPVRWAAAYAIAALREPERFVEPQVPSDPKAPLQAAVRHELAAYLAERRSDLISEVILVDVRRDQDRLTVRGKAKLFDQIPLDLAGGRLRFAHSDHGKPGQDVLEVEVYRMNGHMVGLYQERGEARLDRDAPLVESAFEVTVPASDTGLRIELNLGRRRLSGHEISLIGDHDQIRVAEVVRPPG